MDDGEASSMRLADRSDLQRVIALTDAAYGGYVPLLGGPPVPMTEDYTSRIERKEVWLRESDGQLAGLIVLERHDDHCMIFSVAVAPTAQGKGHGVALLDFAQAKARGWKVGEVRLYTNARMERNIALYTRYGFRETGRRANPHRPGWIIVDMAKPVAA
ncbi:MAG: GNAT family N-acetyltransferase [Rhizobiaceae bacterium]|nr:GNAT family N-acetyltransferase [Rhizobiaceae bacterium]